MPLVTVTKYRVTINRNHCIVTEMDKDEQNHRCQQLLLAGANMVNLTGLAVMLYANPLY